MCGWLFTAIPAVICGHVARAKIRKSGGTLEGLGIATAGLIIGYIGVVIGLLGIPLLIGMIQSDRERARELAVERKECKALDGTIAVNVPGDWIDMPQLNALATIRAGNKSKEQYLIVISEPKSDFQDMTLETHHQTTRNQMLQKMKNGSGTNPTTKKINGYPALQDELHGTRENTNVVFLHTTVDTGDHYHQILAWTLKSRWVKHKDLLSEVTNSFHRTD
jgi:hypothetical protein